MALDEMCTYTIIIPNLDLSEHIIDIVKADSSLHVPLYGDNDCSCCLE